MCSTFAICCALAEHLSSVTTIRVAQRLRVRMKSKTMGTVVQFKAREQSAKLVSKQLLIDVFLLALAQNTQALETDREFAKKNRKAIESIMRITENPELRERLLRQIESMRRQLLLVSLNLASTRG